MDAQLYKLDNPVWHALNEAHQRFSISYPGIKFYDPDFCPFGAMETSATPLPPSIGEYSKLIDQFFIVGQKPLLPAFLEIRQQLPCLQMIIGVPLQLEPHHSIVPLASEHAGELHTLVNLVQPGYFRKKTSSMGNYFGIFKNEALVAVAGERIRLNDFVEVSAIITHPHHTGRGYATQLTAHVVDQIFSRGQVPFLHVLETNGSAIRLYDKLGFVIRRKMDFWSIQKQSVEESVHTVPA